MNALGLIFCMIAPGLTAARFILGARRPLELLWMSILTSLLVFTPLVYPVSLLVGAPTAVAVVSPLLVFALACTRAPRGLLGPMFWSKPAPSRLLWGLALLWFACDVRLVAVLRDWGCSGDPDVPFFFGVLRELGASTPAHHPELAGTFLSLSSGYWFWYACLERLSGLDTQHTLFVVGALLSVVLLVLVHRLSYSLWEDGVAAIASVVLLLIPGEMVWARLLSARTPGFPGFPVSLAIGWYNGPALILMLLSLGIFVWCVRSSAWTRPFVALVLLLVLFPFHHAMYYGITLCGLAPYVAWGVLTRRLPARVLVCFLTWLPWRALAWAWPEAMLIGDPRLTVSLGNVWPELSRTLVHDGALLPLALLGARRLPKGAGALLSVIGVLFLPGPWAGHYNRHWQWDPLTITLSLFAGAGIARIVGNRKVVEALALAWLAPNLLLIVDQPPWRRGLVAIPKRPVVCAGPPGLGKAAIWLRDHSPSSARIAAPPGSIEGQYVEVYGQRALVFGDAFHFDMADPPALWRPAETDMSRLYRSATASEIDEILRRRSVDYVVLPCHPEASCLSNAKALAARLPVAFRSPSTTILQVPKAGSPR